MGYEEAPIKNLVDDKKILKERKIEDGKENT